MWRCVRVYGINGEKCKTAIIEININVITRQNVRKIQVSVLQ